MNRVVPLILVLGVAVLGAVVLHAEPSQQRELALAAVVAVVAGLSATAVGVFGAILVPGLLLLGVDARVAAPISLLLQATVLPLGAGAHAALGNVRRQIAVPLMAGGIVGAVAGVAVASRIPAQLAARAVALVIVAIGILVITTVLARPERHAQSGAKGSTTADAEIIPTRPRLAGTGVLAGLAMGVSGAGWGPISVKLLLLSGVEPRLAVGSSLVGRVGVALSAVGAYAASAAFVERVGIDLQLVVVLVLGSALAVAAGSLAITTAGRRRAVLAIVLLSISLALPSALGWTL